MEFKLRVRIRLDEAGFYCGNQRFFDSARNDKTRFMIGATRADPTGPMDERLNFGLQIAEFGLTSRAAPSVIENAN
jgi:hypothetical protein